MPKVNTKTALDMAYKKMREEYGEDFKITEKEPVVVLFNNAMLTITKIGDTAIMNFTADKPISLDVNLDVYE